MSDSQEPKRVLVGGIYHETHSFIPSRTRRADFTRLLGEELFRAIGDVSPLAGALEAAEQRNWSVIPAIDLRAMPSGIAEDRAAEEWWQHFHATAQNALADGPLDGVFLVLHGAMVCETILDVEGELLERIHGIAGLRDVPLGGVTDLHANFSRRMAQFSDALITYRKNPHTDAKAAAVRAVQILDALMSSGRRPHTVWKQAALVLPPTATATADNPMRTLLQLAADLEAATPDILAVNVHAGFSFADTPDTGVSVTAITTGDPAIAERKLEALVQEAVRLASLCLTPEIPLNEAIEKLGEYQEGPILLVEPADNIGGGTPGDGVTILKAFLDNGITNAAVILNDPEAIAVLHPHALGETVSVEIGGKGLPVYGGPLRLEVELVSRSDGRFTLDDPKSHLASMLGMQIDMGPCAVVRHAGVTILLTSIPTAPFDLGQWRSQGIEPAELFAIGVKAAVGHRGAYDPISRASFTVQTPGPCSSDLKTLPYRHIRRPIGPLDTI